MSRPNILFLLGTVQRRATFERGILSVLLRSGEYWRVDQG